MSELPEGWVDAPIGELVIAGPRNHCGDSTPVGFVPMQAMGTRYRQKPEFVVRPWSEVKTGYTHFADGDVLLARITPCYENGKAGIVTGLPSGLGAGSTEYIVCRPISGVLLPQYLLAYFKTTDFVSNGKQLMGGAVGQQRVPKDYVLNSRLPLAPLNEQKRITDKLDTTLARVDACRERLERIPAILKRFRQAVLAAATSGELLENEDASRTRTLSDFVAQLRTGPFGSALHKSDYVIDGIPVVNPMHINDGKIIPSEGMSISSAKAKELSDFLLRDGDIVIARRGVMGRCAVVTAQEQGWLCGTGSMVIRPTKDVLPEYLQLCLSSPDSVSALEADAVGSTMVNLNQRILLGLNVFVPSISIQQEILQRIAKLFAYADRLEARYKAARAAVDRVTPALLAKAFRGELVPQDPTDKPAAELLARIHATLPATKEAKAKPRRKATPGLDL